MDKPSDFCAESVNITYKGAIGELVQVSASEPRKD